MSLRPREPRSLSSMTLWTCVRHLLAFDAVELTQNAQAKNALDHLNGFHLQERYIVVLYHMPAKQDAAAAKAELARREEELSTLKQKHNIGDD
jgi:hypothetical protein